MRLTNLLRPRTIAVFFINMLAAFLMAVIPHLGFKTALISPSIKQVDPLENITPKLELKQNNFQPKIQHFSQVLAAADLDNASAFGVVDLETAKVLAEKNFSKKLPIASLTKIMTAAVALDLSSPDEQFTVSEKASVQIPTKVMLKPEEKYSLEFLLKSALISSANDSAQVIREGIDQKYGSGLFIRAMNKKADILGLKNTHFASSQGYDDPLNYSSVEDLSTLSAYALNYPLIAQIASESIDDQTNKGQDMRFYLQNWNGLLGVYPGISGLKIGNTDQAGYTTVVVSERAGHKLLAIVLGAPGVLERDLWASQLLDIGFTKLGVPAANITEDQLKTKYAAWKYFE